MKQHLLILVTFCLFVNNVHSQCNPSVACNGNNGILSTNIASEIDYDNMGSAFHSTFIKDGSGVFKVWGEHTANSGDSNQLSPTDFNVANYPELTGTIYRMAIGSDSFLNMQIIVLTSTGLFALGIENAVLSTNITSTSTFEKITVDGQTDGLPVGINPENIKMMFASTEVLMITTCIGEVFVLSLNSNIRGNNSGGSATQWSKVMINATTPLTNIIVARGNGSTAFALKNDGTIWTWGRNTFLGNGTAALTRNYATAMTLPAGITSVKMIQTTLDNLQPSYYILGTNNNVYSLGSNNYGQLGDRSFISRTSWVNAKNPNNTIITDAAWISSNEHDKNYAALAVIKNNGQVFTAGFNSSYMIGRFISSNINFLDFPNGISSNDFVTFAEVGGHTCALIKQCSPRYGYVGHRINGSLGDGTNITAVNQNYDFITPPILNICGVSFAQPTVTTNGPNVCIGENAVFNITGLPGQIINYNINNGTSQFLTIAANGVGQVTVNNPASSQTINLTQITTSVNCTSNIAVISTINLTPTAASDFTQVPAICAGDILANLPQTSSNGITGSWSPALNNLQTTTYTFTPNAGQCALPSSMTIIVSSPNIVPSFTAAPAICVGDNLAALPTSSGNGIVGTWSPNINNLATTNYVFTPNGGQCATNSNITIVVNSATVPLFNAVAPIIIGGNLVNLPTMSLNGIIGSWSPALNNLATTNYVFTPNVGQCATTANVTIVVNPVNIDPTFAAIAAICSGKTIASLPTISLNGISGSWSPPINNLATTTYSFLPNSGQNANSTTLTIIVTPRTTPVFNIFSDLCYNDIPPILPDISTNGIAGSWSPAFIDNKISGVYNFVPTAGQCTNIPNPLNIKIFDEIDFIINAECVDDNYVYRIVPINNTFDVTNSNIIWKDIANTTISENSQLFDFTNYLKKNNLPASFPITINVAVTSIDNCFKKKDIIIDNIYCGIQKGISPNNDNKNDFFDLKLLDVKFLKIYNRYGMVVYSKAAYTNEWSGQSDAGQQLPDATYYYEIEFNNDKPARVGWIYLIQEIKN